MITTPELKNAIGLSILDNHLSTHPGGTYAEIMSLIEDESDDVSYWEPFADWEAEDFYNHIDSLLWDALRAVSETDDPVMYTVSRDEEDVREYLLDDDGECMTFTLEEALSMIGYNSIEEAEENSIYVEEEEWYDDEGG